MVFDTHTSREDVDGAQRQPARTIAVAVEPTSQQFAAQRVLYELTVQRLVQRVYEQRLINNVDRGAYVECMIELALRERHPAWRLTKPWASWDLEHRKTRARIEIKQSAALNLWNIEEALAAGDVERVAAPRKDTKPVFSIKPTTGYWNGATWIKTQLQRQADLYVFAWHPKTDSDIADHRRPDQWKFFVVAEQDLPQEPLTKSIARTRLSNEYGGTECGYDVLATRMVDVLAAIPERRLKAPRV